MASCLESSLPGVVALACAQGIMSTAQWRPSGGLVVSWRSRWETIRRVGPTQVFLARTWNALNGDERAHRSLRLQPNPLVVDVGAYEGDFTALMRRDWNARVIAFEPIPLFVSALTTRFSGDSCVSVVPVALGGVNGSIQLALSDDGSSAWGTGTETVEVPLRDVFEVVADESVALLKINAEGAEFDVLDRLLQTGQVRQVDTIQVQFHRFVPDAVARRRAIRRELRATHRCAWNVPWVWEQWVRTA